MQMYKNKKIICKRFSSTGYNPWVIIKCCRTLMNIIVNNKWVIHFKR